MYSLGIEINRQFLDQSTHLYTFKKVSVEQDFDKGIVIQEGHNLVNWCCDPGIFHLPQTLILSLALGGVAQAQLTQGEKVSGDKKRKKYRGLYCFS